MAEGASLHGVGKETEPWLHGLKQGSLSFNFLARKVGGKGWVSFIYCCVENHPKLLVV